MASVWNGARPPCWAGIGMLEHPAAPQPAVGMIWCCPCGARSGLRIDEWSAARQAENQEETARLIACQRGLDRREATLRQQAQRWEMERLELQQEIGRLREERAAGVEVESLAGA